MDFIVRTARALDALGALPGDYGITPEPRGAKAPLQYGEINVFPPDESGRALVEDLRGGSPKNVFATTPVGTAAAAIAMSANRTWSRCSLQALVAGLEQDLAPLVQ